MKAIHIFLVLIPVSITAVVKPDLQSCGPDGTATCRFDCKDEEKPVEGDNSCPTGDKCCLSKHPCQRDFPAGACFMEDTCPRNFELIQKFGINKPDGVDDWCKDDLICCIRTDKCQDQKGGMCWFNCQEGETPITGNDLCTDPDKTCCVEKDPCVTVKNGECRKDDNCESGERIVPGQCLDSKKICCVKELCETVKDGECKNDCDDKEVHIISKPGCDYCSGEVTKCCVDYDPCEKVKDGECKESCDADDEKEVTDDKLTLCRPGSTPKKCCVVDHPCERETPGGICMDRKVCPDGWALPIDLCIDKPKWVKNWCGDDDHICCVKETN